MKKGSENVTSCNIRALYHLRTTMRQGVLGLTLSEVLEAVVARESFLEAAESFLRQMGREVLRSSKKAASEGRFTWRASNADWKGKRRMDTREHTCNHLRHWKQQTSTVEKTHSNRSLMAYWEGKGAGKRGLCEQTIEKHLQINAWNDSKTLTENWSTHVKKEQTIKNKTKEAIGSELTSLDKRSIVKKNATQYNTMQWKLSSLQLQNEKLLKSGYIWSLTHLTSPKFYD